VVVAKAGWGQEEARVQCSSELGNKPQQESVIENRHNHLQTPHNHLHPLPPSIQIQNPSLHISRVSRPTRSGPVEDDEVQLAFPGSTGQGSTEGCAHVSGGAEESDVQHGEEEGGGQRERGWEAVGI